MAFMYTLIQCLTMDSWNDGIVRIMMPYVPLSWIFFYFYVVLCGIVLMNIVTAIIVNNAINSSASDDEMVLRQNQKKRKEELSKFEALFETLDSDGDGALSKDEFNSAFESPQAGTKLQ